MGAVISTDNDLKSAASALFNAHRDAIFRRTDRLFAFLMIAEWIGCVAIAAWISPRTWIGLDSALHLHLFAAVGLGGLITTLPCLLAITNPGRPLTRYVIAAAQMLMGSLLIHVTGGRIETHFYVFGSLAFISTYRDWRTLIIATIVVAADHVLRGIFFPISIFGVSTVSYWRVMEHIWWVAFEDAFLIIAYATSTREMWAIALRTAELNAARLAAESATEQARQATRTAEMAVADKSIFFANMSHEIRTPLNGVLGVVELLLKTPLTAGQRRYVQVAKGSGTALIALLNNILDFSKMEAQKLELYETVFDLPLLIEDLADIFSSRVYTKGLSLATFVDPTLRIPVCCDQERLRQILTNLISNAVKFTQRGQITIRVWADADNDQEMIARFVVSDTGIGVPADQMNRLFQSFSQGDASTTRQYGGTGLGLAISKQLVQLMSGEMGVSSHPGTGSSFWFTVPLKKSQQSPDKEACTTAPQVRRTLLVDPVAAHRDIIDRQLKSVGLQNTSVASVAESLTAIAAAREANTPFEVVLVDILSAQGSVAQLVESLRLAGAATLLLIATAEEIQAQQSADASAFAGYLMKPVRQTELMDTIAQAAAGLLVANHPSLDEANAGALPTGPSDRKATRKILLVEDNEINQLVAVDMLKLGGFKVELASNGKAAVDAVRARRFDLILMDCQMPVMDGFEATSIIRQLESAGSLPDRVGHLPILALTANAAAEDVSRCLTAGMDGHIGKPFEPQTLLEMVSRFLKSNAPPSEVAGPDAVSPIAPFDSGALLHRCMNKSDLARKVLDLFRDAAPSQFKAITAALAEGQRQAVRSAAHRLKGTASAAGADALADAAAKLEQLSRDTDDDLQGSLEMLQREVDRCIASLPQTLETLKFPVAQ